MTLAAVRSKVVVLSLLVHCLLLLPLFCGGVLSLFSRSALCRFSLGKRELVTLIQLYFDIMRLLVFFASSSRCAVG